MKLRKTLTKLGVILLCAVFCVTVFSCASSGGAREGGVQGAFTWGTFTDAGDQGTSRINLIEDVEMIGSEVYMTYNISGEITDKFQYGYAGWYAFPDDPTKELLQTMRSFSFQVVGDGETYFVMLSTTDVEDHSYHRTTFTTKKDQLMTVHVRVGSLQQPDDWGIKKKFNQDNVTQIQFQTTNNGRPGTFKLKMYDLRLYQ